MLLYKSVKQSLRPDPILLEKMRTFRLMVNDCLMMGFDCKEPSYRAIKAVCHERMLAYQIEGGYRFSAMFEAANLHLLKKSKNAPSRDRCGKPHRWNHSSPLAWESTSKGGLATLGKSGWNSTGCVRGEGQE